jgi:hypothetical protein
MNEFTDFLGVLGVFAVKREMNRRMQTWAFACVWLRIRGTVEVRNVRSNGREICAEEAVLAELNRFFVNELGIDAIVRRPWLTHVAVAVLFAFFAWE